MRPETILEDPDRFWETDRAYVLARHWHRNVNIPLEKYDYYDKWIEFIRSLTELDETERREHPGFVMLNEIKDRKSLFLEKVVPLMDEFLPRNGLHFETQVNITGKTLSYGFMTQGEIVLNVLAITTRTIRTRY